jgi:hypothetical protein
MINIHERDRRSLIRFLVDFNGVTDRNRISALGRHATGNWQQLSPRDYVVAYDSEGNEVVAYVEQRRGNDLFDLRADWDYWTPSDQPRVRIVSPMPSNAETRVPAGLR